MLPEYYLTCASESRQACFPASSPGTAFAHLLPCFKGHVPKYSCDLTPAHMSLLFLLPKMPFPLFRVLAQVEGNTSFNRSSLRAWPHVRATLPHAPSSRKDRPPGLGMCRALPPGLAQAFSLLDLQLSPLSSAVTVGTHYRGLMHACWLNE